MPLLRGTETGSVETVCRGFLTDPRRYASKSQIIHAIALRQPVVSVMSRHVSHNDMCHEERSLVRVLEVFIVFADCLRCRSYGYLYIDPSSLPRLPAKKNRLHAMASRFVLIGTPNL